MEQREKELLDIYERFELTKSAQGAMDFVRRNIDVGREPVEFDLTEEDTNMPVAVDLGLPSGTKWADRNVGAKSEEECGLYFSWGNVDGVEFGKDYDFSDEEYAKTAGVELACDIDDANDAARVNLGEPWRMPTEEQFVELDENCTHEMVSVNGYHGVRFTSKINGNSIFLPCSGFGAGSSWYGRGAFGSYWSASFYSSRCARRLFFSSVGVNPQNYNYRCNGFAVRPVQN